MANATRVYRSTEDRRREIVDATIRVLAEHGFAHASFGRIRDAAGLSSTRLISYHFADKAALLGAVIEHIVTAAGAVMVPAMEQEPTMSGKLAAYIRSNTQFLADHPHQARAAIEVIVNAPRSQKQVREDTSTLLLAVLLTQGQESGEFCAFDTNVVARAIRAAIDAFATTIPRTPAAVEQTIAETVALFDRAVTRRAAPQGG